jgi:hypothetical protein
MAEPDLSVRPFPWMDLFYTPWRDVMQIGIAIYTHKPKWMLEIGTNRGYTSRVLADEFPDLLIVTCDPGDQVPIEERPENQRDEYITQDLIGKFVKDCPRVTVLKEAFHKHDWRRDGLFKFDFIFIDGDHSYDAVLRDTRLALTMLNRPGVIMWHDYGNVADVERALTTLAPELPAPARPIPDSWLAIMEWE